MRERRTCCTLLHHFGDTTSGFLVDSEASLGIQSRVSPMQNTGAELVSPVTVRLARGLSSAISAVSTPNLIIIGLRTCMLSSQFSTITTFLASQEAGRCRVTVIGI
jgi:hypothetical protein